MSEFRKLTPEEQEFDTILESQYELYKTNEEYRKYEELLLGHINNISDPKQAEEMKNALMNIEDMIADHLYKKGKRKGKRAVLKIFKLIGSECINSA